MHLPVSRAKPPPFGGGGFAKQRRRGFRPLTPGRTFPRSAALSQKTALPMITPSVIACGNATFPKGTAFSGGGKVSGSAQRGDPTRENAKAGQPAGCPAWCVVFIF